MASNTSELELPRGLLAEASVAAKVRAEVGRYLPAWMFFFYGCMLLNTGLTNFDPPRPDLAWTAVFPLGVFVVFYVARSLLARDVEQRALMLLTIVALTVAVPAMTLAWHRPSPLTGKGLLVIYEVSNFVWAALMFAHAWRTRRAHAALFFGAGLLYGLVLENGGIVLGFFHETNLTITMVRPLVAPVATMIGWCVVLYMATFVVWQLRRWLPALRQSAMLSGLLVATCATLLDLQIDPHATAAGAWVWDLSLPAWFHGVPRVNFVAWVCALFPFAWAMFRHQDRARLSDGGAWQAKDVWSMVVAVPGALIVAALCFIISTGLLEGINGPSWVILNRFTLRALELLGL